MERLDIIVDVLTTSIKGTLSKEDLPATFGDKRIAILIDKDGVNLKVVTPVTREKKAPRLSPELIQAIQDAKKTLKGKRDAIYLFTLLMSLHNELKNVKVADMDIESRKIIMPAINTVESDMTNLLIDKK